MWCFSNHTDQNWSIPLAGFFIHLTSLGLQYSIGLYFLPISKEFNSNRATTAWMGSICMASMLSLGIASGALMDRYDPRILLSIATTFLSLGLLLGSFANSLPMLFLCIGIAGSSCSVHIQAISILQAWFDKKKGLATGIAMAGSGLGNFLFAVLLGAYFARYPTSWRQAMRWESLFIFVLSIPASLLLRKRVVIIQEETKQNEGITQQKNKKKKMKTVSVSLCSLMTQKRMLSIVFTKFVGAFSYGVPFIHLVPLMNDSNVSESDQALALGIIGLASLSGRVVLGALGDRIGHTRLFQFGMSQLAVSMFLFPHCNNAATFSLLAFYYGFWAGGYPSLPPSIISIWYVDHTNHVGRLVGLNFASDAIGAILGPVIVGSMYDHYGSYIEGFSLSGGLFVVATLISFTMPKAIRRRTSIVELDAIEITTVEK